MGVILAVTHYTGAMDPEEDPPIPRQEPQRSGRNTNPPTKFQPQIYPV